MNAAEIAQLATVIIGVGSISISGVLWNTVQAYKLRVEELEKDHKRNLDRIKELELEIRIVKTVPLKKLSDTNDRIFAALESHIKNDEEYHLSIIKIIQKINNDLKGQA